MAKNIQNKIVLTYKKTSPHIVELDSVNVNGVDIGCKFITMNEGSIDLRIVASEIVVNTID
jgi:hypothetical protein